MASSAGVRAPSGAVRIAAGRASAGIAAPGQCRPRHGLPVRGQPRAPRPSSRGPALSAPVLKRPRPRAGRRPGRRDRRRRYVLPPRRPNDLPATGAKGWQRGTGGCRGTGRRGPDPSRPRGQRRCSYPWARSSQTGGGTGPPCPQVDRPLRPRHGPRRRPAGERQGVHGAQPPCRRSGIGRRGPKGTGASGRGWLPPVRTRPPPAAGRDVGAAGAAVTAEFPP